MKFWLSTGKSQKTIQKTKKTKKTKKSKKHATTDKRCERQCGVHSSNFFWFFWFFWFFEWFLDVFPYLCKISQAGSSQQKLKIPQDSKQPLNAGYKARITQNSLVALLLLVLNKIPVLAWRRTSSLLRCSSSLRKAALFLHLPKIEQ